MLPCETHDNLRAWSYDLATEVLTPSLVQHSAHCFPVEKIWMPAVPANDEDPSSDAAAAVNAGAGALFAAWTGGNTPIAAAAAGLPEPNKAAEAAAGAASLARADGAALLVAGLHSAWRSLGLPRIMDSVDM